MTATTDTAIPIPPQHMEAVAAGAECWQCPLVGSGRGPVPPSIPDDVDIVVVAEAPGSTEVAEGKTLCGASGREIRQALQSAGANMARVGYTNALLCQAEGDLKRYLMQLKRAGKPNPLDCCRPRLMNDLKRARFAVFMGGASLQAVQIKQSVMKVRGTPLVTPGGLPGLAIPHAAFVMRDEGRTFRPVFRADVTKAVRIAYGGNTWKDPWYFVPQTAVEVENFLARRTDRTAVDVETDGIDTWTCNLRRIGIGDAREVMIYSPLSVHGQWMLPQHEAVGMTRAIGNYFQRAPRIDTWNGTIFDSVVLWRHGMPLRDETNFDGLLAHQVGPTSELPHGLDFAASMYTDAPRWKDDVKFSSLPDDRVLDKYLSFDIATTWTCAPYVEQNLVNSQQVPIYTLDAELARIGRSMSTLGLYVDQAKRLEFANEYQEKADRLRGELNEVAGKDVNPNSPPQIRGLLYSELGLPVLESHVTDSGDPSTDESTLLDLLSLGIDQKAEKIIHAVLGCREAEKILGTYTGHVVDGHLEGGPTIHADGCVRSTWRPGKRSGRWGSNDPNCFSGDTEVLTRAGWVRFDELKKNEEIAQWWEEDGRIDFAKPMDYYETDAEEMVSIKLQQIDLLVTPDHRCAVRDKKTGKTRVYPAWRYPKGSSRWLQVHAGRYAGGKKDFGSLLALLVAAQADGSYGYGDRLCFTFKKRRKIQRLEKLLRACRARYKKVKHAGGRTHFEVRGAIALRCRAILGETKTLGSWVLELTRAQLDIFCEEVFFWDGCWARMSMYSSSIKSNCDWVQAALLLSGWRARLRKYQNKTPNAKLNYQIDVTRRDYSCTMNRKLTRLPGQRAYCVSVPSSYILVRRNGTAVVTGQCQNIGKKLRAMYVARPGNVLVAADMQAVELRMIAMLAGDVPLMEAFRAFDNKTGPDVHIFNACTVFRCQPADVTDEIRTFIKRFVYALNYDAEPPKIYQTLSLLRDDNLRPMFPHITLPQIEKLHALWWQLHPAIPVWKKKLIYGYRSRGYVATRLGDRRRYFIGGEKPTEIPNHDVQGCSATMQNGAIRALVAAYPFDYVNHRGLLVNGHDQLVVECAEREAEDVKRLVRHVMEKEIDGVRFPAEPKAGQTWKAVS